MTKIFVWMIIVGVNDLDKFLEIIDNGLFIHSINFLDSNLDIDVTLEQTKLVRELDILPSTFSDKVLQFSNNSSTNNFVFKTLEPKKIIEKGLNTKLLHHHL